MIFNLFTDEKFTHKAFESIHLISYDLIIFC